MTPDFNVSAPDLAKDLIGWNLLYTKDNKMSGGIISEAEAYTSDDEASHSYKGLNKRNYAMFSSPGTIYIYKIYGLHYCLNFVCGNMDGQAVLIRSLIPTVGIEFMKERRGRDDLLLLCNGPANIVQSLGVDPSLNNCHIDKTPMTLKPPVRRVSIEASARIGISKAVEKPWRFKLK